MVSFIIQWNVWNFFGIVMVQLTSQNTSWSTRNAQSVLKMNGPLIALTSIQKQISVLPLLWLCSILDFWDLVHHDKEGNISNGQTWGGEKVLRKGTIWSEQVRKGNLDLNLSWDGRDQHSKAQKRAPRQLGRKFWWLSRSLNVWLKQTYGWEDEPSKIFDDHSDHLRFD